MSDMWAASIGEAAAGMAEERRREPDDGPGELTAHQEAAILDTLPDEVLEQLPWHEGGPADCPRCALLRQHGTEDSGPAGS